MDIAERLTQIRQSHGADMHGAIAALRDLAYHVDTPSAAAYAALVNHVVGDEYGDRPLALDLLRAAGARCAADNLGLFDANLAVAAGLAGDHERAAEARTAAAGAAGPVIAEWIAIRCAEGLMHVPRTERAIAAALPALRAVADVGELPAALDRAMAVSCNNLASALIEAGPGAIPGRDEAIERAALLSRRCWARCGTWVNHERGEYLVALAYNALGRYEEARSAAAAGIAIVKANEPPENVDLAFLHVELALALKGLGRASEAAAARARAEALAAGFAGDAGLSSWFGRQAARPGAEPA